MKTNFRFLALSAAILSMFTACQREELEQNQKPEALTHSVTFVAGAPETKTIATIAGNTVNYSWTAEDVDRFTVYENGEAATKTECGLADGVMTIKATFEGSKAPKTASYVAVVNSSNDSQIITSEAYDEGADILVSKAVSTFDGNNGVKLQFKREVAIAKMTLKGLDPEEVIDLVTVSSTADIAGSYGVNGWASPAKTAIEIASESYMLDGTEGSYSIEANASGEAVVWFTCIPQTDATLTVKVVAADGDTYTKEFSKPITLTRGDVKAFGVEMVKDVVAKPWVAVDLSDIDETMPLVITMATTDKTYALSLTGTDDNALGTSKAPKAIEVSVVDGKLSEEPSSDILWNIANNNGNLTIYPNGVTNKWLYTISDNNGVRLGTNTTHGYVWSIDATSGYLKANVTTSVTTSEVRYLGVYVNGVNGPDWRAYTNTTGNIANQNLRFYSNSITEDPKAPKLSVTPTSKTWASDETDAAVFTVTTNTEGETGWTVSHETLNWATVKVDEANGTITVTPNDENTTETARVATLTVTHSTGTLSETITLTQKGAEKIATLAITSAVTSSNITLTDDQNNSWTFTTDGDLSANTSYIQAGTNKKKVTYVKLVSTGLSSKKIKKIQLWGTSKANSNVTPKIIIRNTTIGTGSAYTTQNASDGGTEFSIENTTDVVGEVTLEISRPSSATGAIYFNKAVITYAE